MLVDGKVELMRYSIDASCTTILLAKQEESGGDLREFPAYYITGRLDSGCPDAVHDVGVLLQTSRNYEDNDC